MKKVLIALGSVMILAFTGCGGASGVQSGSEVSSVEATSSEVAGSETTNVAPADAAVGSEVEGGVTNSSLIAEQIVSQAKFLGQPVNGIN